MILKLPTARFSIIFQNVNENILGQKIAKISNSVDFQGQHPTRILAFVSPQ